MNAARPDDGNRASALARDLGSALADLDRRTFLRGLAVAAGAGLLPTGCGSDAQRAQPPPDLVLRNLTPRTYAVLVAAAERIVGGRGAPRIRSGEVEPGASVEALLASSPALAEPLRTALLALEFGFFPLVAKLRPFTALDAAGRDAVLDELMGSRWSLKRTLFKGVKSVCLLGYYGAAVNQPVSRLLAVGDVGIDAAMTYDLSS